MKNKILTVNNLRTYFFVDCEQDKLSPKTFHDDEILKNLYLKNKNLKNKIPAKAVDDVSFDIFEGEIVGLVGESGSGKSVTAYSILKLIQDPPGKIVSGNVFFKGVDLLNLNDEELRNYRGKEISFIFQEPTSALNPVMKIENQIMEVILEHEKCSKSEAGIKTLRMLEYLGIPEPQRRMKQYPHQLSGGMCQRVVIAMALICNPSLIIADEPTTNLDVTVQAQILNLIKKFMSERKNSSMLLITHNFGIVSELCNRVIVMYGGKIQEIADVPEIFSSPAHPYTVALLESLITTDCKHKGVLKSIPGVVPNPLSMPEGCKFSGRCPEVFEKCHKIEPDLTNISKNHLVRCHLKRFV